MDAAGLRNFKDFLLHYNKISEDCFSHCVNDLSCMDLTSDEQLCVERCAYKHVKMNNKAMEVYAEVQPIMTQRRIDEMNKQMEAKKASQESVANVEQTTTTPDVSVT